MNEYPQNQGNPNPYQQYQPYYQEHQEKSVITMGEWLKLFSWMLFSLIPAVGWIVTIVIYIVKMTDKSQPETIRNFLKAAFIVYGIVILLSIALFIVIMVITVSNAAFFDAYPGVYGNW